MIRGNLRYHRPSAVSEAAALLAEHAGDIGPLAGGTQLLPRMNRDEIRLGHVVDLSGLGLSGIGVQGGEIEIGAMVTYADVLASAELREAVPLLVKMAGGITGGAQLTRQATLAGSACLNFPGSDIPGVLVALDARIRLAGPAGTRDIPAAEFLLGAERTDIRPGEFVTSFVVGRAPKAGYCKVKHATGSWPIATASAVPGDDGAVTITLGAVQAVPVRFSIADRDDIPGLVRTLVTDPWSDVLAPGSYRAAIAGVVARRALADLLEAG
jgi:aerobic carbon-monoxide dehydrogenase medium subunit